MALPVWSARHSKDLRARVFGILAAHVLAHIRRLLRQKPGKSIVTCTGLRAGESSVIRKGRWSGPTVGWLSIPNSSCRRTEIAGALPS